MSRPEVLVVGGGTMGVASAWALARRGLSVRVLERYEHVHDRGSHGGFTRIIRHAYHEGADYVDLVREADRLWTALGQRRGQALLERCGLLEFGPRTDPDMQASLHALQLHQIPHDTRPSTLPFQIPDAWVSALSPRCGYLRVRPCLDALRAEAAAAGAEFEYGVRVREIVSGGDLPRVTLDSGAIESADHVVVAAGAYTADLLPGYVPRGLLVAKRRVLVWIEPPAAACSVLSKMPCWGAFTPRGFFYGFPHGSEGVRGLKLAWHRTDDDPIEDAPVQPTTMDREIHEADLHPVFDFLKRYLPLAGTELAHATTCMYAMTPSSDFLIDHLGIDDRVVVATGFSGHGFKFAPVIGETVADLVTAGQSTWRLKKFTRSHHVAAPGVT